MGAAASSTCARVMLRVLARVSVVTDCVKLHTSVCDILVHGALFVYSLVAVSQVSLLYVRMLT